MAEQTGPLQKRVKLADGSTVILPADAVVRRTWREITSAHKPCPRCEEWSRLGLSSTCPSCDAEMLAELDGPLGGTW